MIVRICCAGIAVLLNRISKPKVTVAVDGSLYRFHPHFHQLMMTMTKSLVQPGLDVSTCQQQITFVCDSAPLGEPCIYRLCDCVLYKSTIGIDNRVSIITIVYGTRPEHMYRASCSVPSKLMLRDTNGIM